MKILAFEGGVMTCPDNTIEITAEQYMEAIEGMMNGKVVTIAGGFAVIDPPQPEEEPNA